MMMKLEEKKNMKFNIRRGSYLLLLVATITSCTSYKKVPYLQSEGVPEREYELISYYKDNTVRFQPDDLLGITVNTPAEQNIATDYNLPFQPIATPENSNEAYINTGIGRVNYLVDKEGYIDYPVIGRIKVEGYTQAELEKYIKETLLTKHLKTDVIVTVRLLNFKVTVQGEVVRPGQFSISGDHINVIEALALAGNMTIYGKRDDVMIVREMPDGGVKFLHIDVSKDSAVSSPDFYLHQNDMVFVTPNRSRADNADIGPQYSLMISLGSFAMTLISFVIYLSSR
jgi:polysaccharide export outer membrane protein